MSIGEISLLIGLLINACAIVLAAWINAYKLRVVIADVHKIELSTNSMKDELVQTTKLAAHAQGDLEGRADLKAEQDAEQKKK